MSIKVIDDTSKRCWTWSQMLALIIVVGITAVSVSWLLWNQVFTKKLELGNLIIEVKIKDLTGTLQPVTGNTFFLISKNLEDIASEYVSMFIDYEKNSLYNSLLNKDKPHKWITLLTGSTALRSLLFDTSSNMERINVWDFRQNFEKSKLIWNDYVMQKAVTNNIGTARFESIPVQEYWIVGWTLTHTGLSFWEHWINLKVGTNQLLLRPENAVYCR